jgi:hypothetical protein
MFYKLNYIRVWLVIGKRGRDQSISYYFEIFFIFLIIFELLDAT